MLSNMIVINSIHHWLSSVNGSIPFVTTSSVISEALHVWAVCSVQLMTLQTASRMLDSLSNHQRSSLGPAGRVKKMALLWALDRSSPVVLCKHEAQRRRSCSYKQALWSFSTSYSRRELRGGVWPAPLCVHKWLDFHFCWGKWQRNMWPEKWPFSKWKVFHQPQWGNVETSDLNIYLTR